MRNKARADAAAKARADAAAKAAAKAAQPQDRRGDQKPKKAAPKAQARQARAQDAPPAPSASDAAALQAMFASFLASQGLSAAAQPAAEVEPEVEVEPERVVEDEPERRQRGKGRGRHHGAPTAAQIVGVIRWVIHGKCSLDDDLPDGFPPGTLCEVAHLTRDLRQVASSGSSSSSSDVPPVVPKPSRRAGKGGVFIENPDHARAILKDLVNPNCTKTLEEKAPLLRAVRRYFNNVLRAKHVAKALTPAGAASTFDGVKASLELVPKTPEEMWPEALTEALVAQLPYLLKWELDGLVSFLPKVSEVAEATDEVEGADPLWAD